eukprot:6318853-Pyramimonas_sp.AAC.2
MEACRSSNIAVAIALFARELNKLAAHCPPTWTRQPMRRVGALRKATAAARVAPWRSLSKISNHGAMRHLRPSTSHCKFGQISRWAQAARSARTIDGTSRLHVLILL